MAAAKATACKFMAFVVSPKWRYQPVVEDYCNESIVLLMFNLLAPRINLFSYVLIAS